MICEVWAGVGLGLSLSGTTNTGKEVLNLAGRKVGGKIFFPFFDFRSMVTTITSLRSSFPPSRVRSAKMSTVQMGPLVQKSEINYTIEPHGLTCCLSDAETFQVRFTRFPNK